MNKTLTVALSMCAGVAMVGAGVFASSTEVATDTTTSSVSSKTRQGIVKEFKKFNGTIGSGRVMSSTITAAIEANDYSKLSTDEQSKITKEQFSQMVTMHSARKNHEAAILAAVKSNDFTAYQTAQSQFKTLMDANKPSDMTDDKARPELTAAQQQEQFTKLVEYYKTNNSLPQMGMGMGKFGPDRDGKGMSSTITAAIEANDYSKLSTDEQSKITKEQFSQMVTMKNAKSAHQLAVETAVKSNDFTAFKKAHTEFKTLMDANKPSDMTDDKTRPEPTDTELKTRFDEMVSYYKTNGSLPEMNKDKSNKSMMKSFNKQMTRKQNQSSKTTTSIQ